MAFKTDPVHGGKITCHWCEGFVEDGENSPAVYRQGFEEDWFCSESCWNEFAEYYRFVSDKEFMR